MTWGTVASGIRSAVGWLGSDAAGNLGGLVGATAAVYALCWGRKEVVRWRSQRREERRREVAGQCLLAIIRAAHALGRWTGHLVSSEAVVQHGETLWAAARRSYDEGMQWATGPMSDLQAAHALALAYLGASERAPIEEAFTLRDAIEDRFVELHTGVLLAETTDAKLRDELRGFDTLTRSAVALLQRGEVVLGPVARYER